MASLTPIGLEILERAPGVLVVAASCDGEVLFANHAFEELPPAGDAEGSPSHDGGVPQPTKDVLVAACRRVASSGAAEAFDVGRLGPAGPLSWYQCCVTPLRLDGRAAAAVCRDVTAFKQEEARLRRSESLLIDAQGIAHLGTWEWNPSEPAVVWSAEVYRIFGVTPDEFTPSYEGYLQRLHPEDRERVGTVMTRAAAEHRSFSHDERILRPDGSIRYLHSWGHPVLDASGRLVRMIGVCQDITDRQLAQIALREALAEANATATANARLYAEAKKALGMRDDFLSIASHELRTPLTPLSLQLQLLRRRIREGLRATDKGAATQDLLKLIETSDRQLARLSRLVDDLLDVSRIRTGRLTLMPGDVDLSELVREILDNFGPELTRAGCSAERQIQPHVVGQWDRVRIEQMVVNLLTNAMKYGAGKPIRVTVSADSGAATFQVQDFGIGIAKEDQPRIFDCFERAASVRHFGGLGLGLYIARQIAEHHGGTIGVDSEPGAGATFRVTLPLRPGGRRG